MNISIIINCYNSENFIQDCISSVLNQTYKKFELIIYDNCSTDNTSKIANSFDDKRINYFKAKKKSSLGFARNEAVKMASFDWVTFIDSDDKWEKNKLYEQINYINCNKNKPLVYTDFAYIDHESNYLNKKSYTKYYEVDVFKEILFNNYICFSSILFNKNYLNYENIFNPILQNSEDLDLLLKITKNYDVGYIKKKLVNYRLHKKNLTKFQLKRSFAEWQYIMFKYSNNYINQKKKIKRKYLIEKIKQKIKKLFNLDYH